MRHSYYLYLLIGSLLLSGCAATRLLQADEYLLAKQRIKGTQKVSKRALTAYYQQQPNATWLGIPWKLWAYSVGQHNFDKKAIQQRIVEVEAKFDTKIALAGDDSDKKALLEQKKARKIQSYTRCLEEGNLLMRNGEPPVIYSPQQRTLTEKSLLTYLQSKGYFDAQVSSTLQLHGQRASVTYHIQENAAHLIGALRRNVADEAIEEILQAYQKQSLLNQGDIYDQEVLEKERERIYALLRNHGYFDFNRQYIWFNVAITAGNAVAIETVIGNPADGQMHLVYHIDEVVWDVDEEQLEKTSSGEVATYKGITFKNLPPQFDPPILAKKLLLHPPQLYRKQDLIKAQQRIAQLGMFRHVHMTYDVIGPGRLIPCIHTSPVDRFQFASELGFQASQWLPSVFCKLSLAGKNIFGRLETLKLEAQVGFEGVAAAVSEDRVVSSQALGVDLSLSWPQFLLPLLTDATQARIEHLNPQTSLGIGYDFSRRPGYAQGTFKSFLKYGWKDQGHGTYEWTPLRVDLMTTHDMSEDFAKVLSIQRSSLEKSLHPSWVTLFSFKGTFLKQPASDLDLSYSALELFFESGGTLQNFIDLRKLIPGLTYYQYVKLNCTYSQHIPIGSGTIFAYRINTGIANPYGEYKVLPYNRYYFLGGGSDMRGWRSRRLGPGTYSAGSHYHLEQPGELLLQGSVELRQRLAGPLEGALFMDIGNIWTLREDGRRGGQFSFQNFHKALAVDTGLGVRLNLRFLVLRLDLGLKLYDPGRLPGKRFMGLGFAPDQAVFNFGIGYPF